MKSALGLRAFGPRDARTPIWHNHLYRLSSMRFHFSDSCLDTDRRELSEDGSPVHLTPKALHLLQLLDWRAGTEAR
jgi:DNA-binding response OmpR family regulator